MKMTLNEEIELLRNGKWFDKIGGTLPNDEYLNLGWAIGDVLDTLELLRVLQLPYENPVLVYDNSGVGMAWYSSTMGWMYRTGLGCVDVTHWRPLPEAPKEG